MNRMVWYGLAVLGIALFLYRVRVVLTPFLFAAVIAYVLYPLVKMFEERQVPKVMAILLVYLLFGTVVGVLFWVTVPRLISELDEIVQMLPSQTERLEGLGQDALRSLKRITIPDTLQEGINLVVERLEVLVEDLAARIAQILMNLVSHIIAFLISPVLAFYLLRDHEAIKERLLQYVPAPYRGEVQGIFREVNKVLNGFFRGQVVVSALVGLIIYAGLAVLQIRYALFVGLLAGLFDIIPYFGPIIGFIPAAGFALLKSPITVLWVVVIFVGANQLESSVIAPKLIGERVGLHPLAVIFSVFVGGELMGITGMLVAVPFAAILRVLIQHFSVRKSGSP
ncbi:MAG: AI-2E family transporter [Firmicutes bacterium]|mgnify:FL=1|nr:AI-2E family transporter [Bacillota bacterium]